MCDLTMESLKPTVGKVAYELMQKAPETRSPIEQMRESLSDYDKNMYECITKGKKELGTDFFIEVITKKEPLLPNVLRNYFIPRRSCPTPNYDQTVYKLTLQNDQIEFLWVIPARSICFLLLEHRLEVPAEEWGLLENILKFESGELFRLCKQLNGEE